MRGLWWREGEHYGGHRVHGPPGAQEAAFSLLLQHDPPRTGVLDLASGSGAMLARLGEAGFQDLHAVARVSGTFGRSHETAGPGEASFESLDLNRPFAGHYERRFGVVVSSEVIEHLDSPRAFLQQVFDLLEPGGYLLLTTPNVANWVGRLRFLVVGELRWFDRRLTRTLHHVSPIPDPQMRLMLEELGFDLVATTSAGSFFGPLATLVTAPISLPFLLLAGRRAWGDCNVYLATKLRAAHAEHE